MSLLFISSVFFFSPSVWTQHVVYKAGENVKKCNHGNTAAVAVLKPVILKYFIGKVVFYPILAVTGREAGYVQEDSGNWSFVSFLSVLPCDEQDSYPGCTYLSTDHKWDGLQTRFNTK